MTGGKGLICEGLGSYCALILCEEKQAKLQTLMQMAWTFINDRLGLCVSVPIHAHTCTDSTLQMWANVLRIVYNAYACLIFDCVTSQVYRLRIFLSLYRPCSLCTTLSLHWEPQTIAVAFLYLAAKLSKTSIHTLCGTRKSWWRQFVDTVDEHDLEGTYVGCLTLAVGGS